MGKLINMMQSNLFGKRKTIENDNNKVTANGGTPSNLVTAACSLSPVTFTIDGSSKTERNTSNNTAFRQNAVFPNNSSTVTENKGVNINGKPLSSSNGEIKTPGNTEPQQSTEEKLYELERCYLFEQNNIIDKYENEKVEMLEKHAEEKLRAKRAYDHEKDELLKEIERKDKMLFELTNLMKEECADKLEEQKIEFVSIIGNKHKLYVNIEAKLKTFIDSLTNFFKNNEKLSENVCEYKELLGEYERFVKSIDTEKTSNDFSSESPRQMKTVCEVDFPSRLLERQFSEPCSSKPKFNRANSYDHENLNGKRQAASAGAHKVVSRTSSDNVRLTTNDCCRKHCRDRTNSDEAIQHELAQAYRKQKAELLKLFSSEKEQYEKKVDKDKDYFERETRAEYVKRMAVERKAWQETIEDYEREISILKYERQQMDTNYCIGMDKMKTEFEREKNSIHRRYNESCLQLKKNLEEKFKNPKIVDDLKGEGQQQT